MSTEVARSPAQPAPRREGSPWTGLQAVVAKELADHLTGVRMQILETLMLLTAVGTVYAATQSIRQTIGEDPFLFLRLFTTAREPLPSFVGFLGFLIPLTAIALGFDAINGEYNRRTLSRVLSQPIYRDALILGKFLAGLATLAITLVALWVVVTGMGLFVLGIPPGGEEVARGLLFLVATLAYAGIWMSLSMLFSTLFRQPATSAMTAIAVWLLFAVFWDMLAALTSQALRPTQYGGGGGGAGTGTPAPAAGAFLTQHPVRGDRDRLAKPRGAVLGPGAHHAAGGRGAGYTPAPGAEPAHCVAAVHRPGSGGHPAVCGYLRAVPTAGGAGVAGWAQAWLLYSSHCVS